MTQILYYSTLALTFSGFLFSLAFIWINVFGRYSDLADRNANMLKIVKVSMRTAMAFALLSCLLSENGGIADAIARSSILYSYIAIAWLAVIALCGVAMLLTVISRKHYSTIFSSSIKKLFKIALPGAIVCLICTWLFS